MGDAVTDKLLFELRNDQRVLILRMPVIIRWVDNDLLPVRVLELERFVP
jgi:hypothetical protein